MGIIKREIIEYTCDLCSSPTDEYGCEIAIQVLPGDGRDVGPSVLRGAITLYAPYGVANGVVCHPCKIKWLRKYLGTAA